MIKLYVCEISNLIEEIKADKKALDLYTDPLGTTRMEHILKNNRAEDRARALGASLLLLFVLKEEGYKITTFPDLTFSEKGKPCLKEFEHLYFNISHTKNIIACVISNREAGVDVEHVREMKKATINKVFSESEKQMAKYCDEGYIRLWTMKEAYSKLTGEGISEILEGLKIANENHKKIVKKLNQDIRKETYYIVAEGKLQDCSGYPYYYSVCSNVWESVDVKHIKWNNHCMEYCNTFKNFA